MRAYVQKLAFSPFLGVFEKTVLKKMKSNKIFPGHLDQSKCAMLDLSKKGCGQIWSLLVTRTSNDVFQQNLLVWIG